MADLIDERIADIEELDLLRRRARTLQQEAVEALTAEIYLPQPRNQKTPGWEKWKRAPERKREGWCGTDDDVEKAMMLLALRKLPAKQPGRSEIQRQSCENIRKDLLKIRVEDCAKNKDLNPRESLDSVPILRCAMVLQALVGTDGCALKQAALACFYRIVLELSEIVTPTWSGGAARASTDALASAFITGECARALGVLENAMLGTAEAAELIAQEKTRIAGARSEVPVWREQEEAFRASALYASLNGLWPRLAVKLSDEQLLNRLGKLAGNRTNLADELASLVDELEAGLTATLGDIPSVKDILRAAVPASPGSATATVAQIVANELGGAAQNAARLFLTKLIASRKNNQPPSVVGGMRVARNFREAAQIVHDLLEPITRFAESAIDRELARPQLGLTVDGAELIFAACLLGRRSGWHQPRVAAAFELARQLLTADGRLSNVQPFNIKTGGYRLNVAIFEVTRRMAELAARVEIRLEPAFVKILMRPFEHTRAPGPDDSLRGWMTDPRGGEAKSEWWVTALAFDALTTMIAMLDAEINRQVLEHFHVLRPVEIDLNLAGLFYPDYGITALRNWDRSVAVKLQELRIHAGRGPREQTPLYSLVLYGPPGTGKTTLVEAIAKSADVPLVEITPSDILVGGEEAIERRTRHVFRALTMLTNVVILFDEFDPILQDRAKRKGNELPNSIFEFLTPGMLPKLKRLHESAKDNRVSYVLATNFVYNLDPAVIRQGRFDDQHGIYPPDAASRLGRLSEQLKRQNDPELKLDNADKVRRLLHAVCKTGGGGMDQIARPGWYSAKKFPRGFPAKSLFHYIKTESPMDEVRQEAKFDEQWPVFAKHRNNSPTVSPPPPISDPALRERMSKPEKQYWDDWSAIYDWDAELAKEIKKAGGTATVKLIGNWLTRWIKARRVLDAGLP
jgi:hypothetical protein